MVTLGVFFCLSLFLFSVWGVISSWWSLSLLGLTLAESGLSVTLDAVSLVCLFMLLFCGGIALFYCYHYFGGGMEASLLYPLMVWFLSVMVVLVLSSSPLMSLLMWEYLGVVSFFLILFYSNMASLRASLITLFASRFGDVALFLIIGGLSRWLELSYLVGGVMLLLVVLTKSACYPFISWLLEAMRAPTPVSSLVHSSTLVAAGAWYFFRYGYLFESWVMSVMLVLGLSTVVITGCCALVFNDLKKMVALSTCNNVSWCLIFYICGDLDLALLQLLTHGVCKCYLFMSIGDLMGSSGSSQSAVGVYLPRYSSGLMVYLQSVLILSLCGVPFLGVFFSKHALLSSVSYVWGWGFGAVLFMGVFLSYAYSFRFVMLLLKDCGGLVAGYSSVFLMVSGLAVLGTAVNAGGLAVLAETSGLSVVMSGAVLLLQLAGFGAGWQMYTYSSEGPSLGSSTLSYSDSVVKSLYSTYLVGSWVSFLSFYRWELYLVSLWPRLVGEFMLLRRSIFSFNVFVFFILLSFLIHFLLGV